MCPIKSCTWKLEWLAEWKQGTKINLNKELNYYTLKKLFILFCVDRKCVADVWFLALKSDSRLEINKNHSKHG